MLKIQTLVGEVYTELPLGEVRQYLQKGNKGGSIDGFLEETKDTPILIATQSIIYIHK